MACGVREQSCDRQISWKQGNIKESKTLNLRINFSQTFNWLLNYTDGEHSQRQGCKSSTYKLEKKKLDRDINSYTIQRRQIKIQTNQLLNRTKSSNCQKNVTECTVSTTYYLYSQFSTKNYQICKKKTGKDGPDSG